MKSIIDCTIEILASMNLEAKKITSTPGFAGIQVDLPNDSQAFFVWSKMDGDDFHFRLARFWSSENPFSMFVSPTLPDALAKTRVLIK
jgi:hypothetical protein